MISEELGFLGGLTVLALYTIIIIRGLYLATKVKNRFASIAAIGAVVIRDPALTESPPRRPTPEERS